MGTADPVASAVLLGFVLGMQHATDPDHLVAVATIVTGERRLRRGALIGILWGLGHTVTLALAGVAIITLDLTIPAGVGTGLELLVALMLIVLGVVRLGEMARGLEAVERDHLVAEHEHGRAEAFHSHPHRHSLRAHQHLHLHPSRRLVAALGRGRWGERTVLVGAVHGLAGSAAVALLVLATVRSSWGAFLYLAVFGFGTMAGMTAFTLTLACPAYRILRYARAGRALTIGSALGSIAFGLAYGFTAF